MQIETRAVLLFTILGLFVFIPFIAANYNSPSFSAGPTGMIINSVHNDNYSSPYAMTRFSGYDNFTETIQTPYGEFIFSIRHDEIRYQLEGNGMSLIIIERPDSRSEVLQTPEFFLNKTQTPTRMSEEFRNRYGWMKNYRESGADFNYSECSNLSYMTNLLSDARELMENEKQNLENAKAGLSLPGQAVSTKGIYINEFLPNPAGDDGDAEWIEVFNNMSINVSLGGWEIDDESGGSDPYEIPSGTYIPAKGFLVFKSNVTDILLNNNGDSVRLFDNSGNMADSKTYDSSSENSSIGRVPDGSDNWVNISIISPGYSNG